MAEMRCAPRAHSVLPSSSKESSLMRPGLASWMALTSMVLLACSSPAPATLEFVDQNPARPRLGEITTLRFRAVDSRGMPQAGTQVRFSLQSEVPGVQLSPAEGTTNPGDGIVSMQVTATGGRVTSVVVVASAGEGAEAKSVISPVISFAGTNSSSRQLTFQCGSWSGEASGLHHALGAWDEARSLIAGVKVNCIAHVGDRNGDGIEGAQVSFLTEAGTIGPTATSLTDVVGNAQVLYKTSLPLPQDVDPGEFTWNPTNDATHTGEYLAPLWMQPFLWEQNPLAAHGTPAQPQSNRPEPQRADPIRPNKINNPRDNLVALIAVTSGEEAFSDDNNNGQWDTGEAFVDLTEPFVDNNDNGTWDAGERFVDTNGNGRWDGKNGVHDTSTLIWVQERILWTGVPHTLDRPDTVRQISPPPPATNVAIDHFGSASATFLVADPWFNMIAQNSQGDGCNSGAEGPIEIEPAITGAIPLTYPSYAVVRYLIKDKHDVSQEPQPGPFPQPIPWKSDAVCTYTAAQLDGHKVR
jgi:hypothetical protein